MIKDLPYMKRDKICRMLNVERFLGGDFKTLAGELGMTNQNIKLISERGNPTEEVLTWWETKKCATTHYFRQILQKMGRDDVVEELDRVHQPGTQISLQLICLM